MSRPLFSQREAADACGVSRSTIRRRREAGAFPGAVRDDAKGWLIPVEDLLAAGLRVGAPAPADEEPAADPAQEDEQLATLRRELADERHRRQLAEADNRSMTAILARQDTHLADLRRALLALAPGSTPASPGPGSPAAGSRAHEHPPGTPPARPATAHVMAPATAPAAPGTAPVNGGGGAATLAGAAGTGEAALPAPAAPPATEAAGNAGPAAMGTVIEGSATRRPVLDEQRDEPAARRRWWWPFPR